MHNLFWIRHTVIVKAQDFCFHRTRANYSGKYFKSIVNYFKSIVNPTEWDPFLVSIYKNRFLPRVGMFMCCSVVVEET